MLRFNFTQEYFDPMCIDLGDLRLARAVAASSSVPMVFAPITLNNNGGRCNYTPPIKIEDADDSKTGRQQSRTIKEFYERFQKYADGKNRPYIHLIDVCRNSLLNPPFPCSLQPYYPPVRW